jgi:hypothetical protein
MKVKLNMFDKLLGKLRKDIEIKINEIRELFKAKSLTIEKK